MENPMFMQVMYMYIISKNDLQLHHTILYIAGLLYVHSAIF